MQMSEKNPFKSKTHLGLKFAMNNYEMKLIYDERDTTLADTCFSNITIAHSVY